MLYWSLDTTDDNLAKDNVVFGSALFDLFDDGTGIGNVWRDNQCNTANF